nr:MAG: polyprotein [Inner Mongolia sediment flavi-like virus 3]
MVPYEYTGEVPPQTMAASGGRLSAADVDLLLRRSVFGYNPSDSKDFSYEMISKLKFGTRVVASKQVFQGLSRVCSSVVDLSAGIGAEAKIASRFFTTVAAWDSDPTCALMSRKSDLLFDVSVDYPYGDFEVGLVDPWWGDRYDRDCKTLDLTDLSWLFGVFNRAACFKPRYIVMKVAKYVKIADMERILHVQFTNTNTSYLVRSETDSSALIPIIRSFEDNPNCRLSIYNANTKEVLSKNHNFDFDNHDVVNLGEVEKLAEEVHNKRSGVAASRNCFGAFSECVSNQYDFGLNQSGGPGVEPKPCEFGVNYSGGLEVEPKFDNFSVNLSGGPGVEPELYNLGVSQSGGPGVEPIFKNVCVNQSGGPGVELNQKHTGVNQPGGPGIEPKPHSPSADPLGESKMNPQNFNLQEGCESGTFTQPKGFNALFGVHRLSGVERLEGVLHVIEEDDDHACQFSFNKCEGSFAESDLKKELIEGCIKTAFGLEVIPSVLHALIAYISDIDLEPFLKRLLDIVLYCRDKLNLFVQTNEESDASLETSDAVALKSLLLKALAYVVKVGSESAVSCMKEIIRVLVGEKLHTDFERKHNRECFTVHPRIVKLSGAFSEGSGFWYKGTLVTAYHVTKGEPVMLNNRKVKCSGYDKLCDLAWYGGPRPDFSRAYVKQKLYVSTPKWKGEGVVLSTAPLQVKFNGSPMPGLSGSPIFDASHNVYGIYSVHKNGPGSYLCIDTCGAWVDVVSEMSEQKSHLNVYVPCGKGKSTYLMQTLARKGETVLCVMPRAALPSEVSAMSSGMKGVRSKGFAGEDKYEPGDANLVYITHGKVVSILQNNPSLLERYSMIVVDEAHDLTALTRSVITWIDEVWKEKPHKKSILMTGSPLGENFTNLAEKSPNFPVERVNLQTKQPLDILEMARHLLSTTQDGDTHLVQVPSSAYYAKLREKLKLMGSPWRFELISRANVSSKGFDYYVKAASEKNIIICATNLLNIGFTLSCNRLTLQGSMYQNDVGNDQISTLEMRTLTPPELSQWLGRVGRNAPGVAYVPNIPLSVPRLPKTEALLLEAYLICLGISKTGMVDGKLCSFAKATTVVKMPFGVTQSLGMVNDDGVVTVKSAENAKDLSELGLPVTLGVYETRLIHDSSGGFVRGAISGCDVLAVDFNNREGLGRVEMKPIKTGLTLNVLLALLFASLRYFGNKSLEVTDSFEAAEETQKGPSNHAPPVPLEPGIMIKDFDTQVDDSEPMFDSISTDWKSSLINWLDTIMPFLNTSRHGGVQVYSKLCESKLATMLAYYLDGYGISGCYSAGVDFPNFRDDELDNGYASNDYMEDVKRRLQRKHGSIKTSHVLTATLMFFHGIPSLAFLLMMSWLLYGDVGPTLSKYQRKMKAFIEAADIISVRNSPFGRVCLKTCVGFTWFTNPVVLFSWLITQIKMTLPLTLNALSMKIPIKLSINLPKWFAHVTQHIEFSALGLLAREYLPGVLKTAYPESGFSLSWVLGKLANKILFDSPLIFKMLMSSGENLQKFFRSGALSVFTESKIIKLLVTICVYQQPLWFGVPQSVLFSTLQILSVAFIAYFGPEFRMWTIAYPAIFSLMGLYGALQSVFVAELAGFGLFVYHLRLMNGQLKTMLSKGSFKNFTSRDDLVRIINGRLHLAKSKLVESKLWRTYGPDGCFFDGVEFHEVVALTNDEVPNLSSFTPFHYVREIFSGAYRLFSVLSTSVLGTEGVSMLKFFNCYMKVLTRSLPSFDDNRYYKNFLWAVFLWLGTQNTSAPGWSLLRVVILYMMRTLQTYDSKVRIFALAFSVLPVWQLSSLLSLVLLAAIDVDSECTSIAFGLAGLFSLVLAHNWRIILIITLKLFKLLSSEAYSLLAILTAMIANDYTMVLLALAGVEIENLFIDVCDDVSSFLRSQFAAPKSSTPESEEMPDLSDEELPNIDLFGDLESINSQKINTLGHGRASMDELCFNSDLSSSSSASQDNFGEDDTSVNPCDELSASGLVDIAISEQAVDGLDVTIKRRNKMNPRRRRNLKLRNALGHSPTMDILRAGGSASPQLQNVPTANLSGQVTCQNFEGCALEEFDSKSSSACELDALALEGCNKLVCNQSSLFEDEGERVDILGGLRLEDDVVKGHPHSLEHSDLVSDNANDDNAIGEGEKNSCFDFNSLLDPAAGVRLDEGSPNLGGEDEAPFTLVVNKRRNKVATSIINTSYTVGNVVSDVIELLWGFVIQLVSGTRRNCPSGDDSVGSTGTIYNRAKEAVKPLLYSHKITWAKQQFCEPSRKKRKISARSRAIFSKQMENVDKHITTFEMEQEAGKLHCSPGEVALECGGRPIRGVFSLPRGVEELTRKINDDLASRRKEKLYYSRQLLHVQKQLSIFKMKIQEYTEPIRQAYIFQKVNVLNKAVKEAKNGAELESVMREVVGTSDYNPDNSSAPPSKSLRVILTSNTNSVWMLLSSSSMVCLCRRLRDSELLPFEESYVIQTRTIKSTSNMLMWWDRLVRFTLEKRALLIGLLPVASIGGLLSTDYTPYTMFYRLLALNLTALILALGIMYVVEQQKGIPNYINTSRESLMTLVSQHAAQMLPLQCLTLPYLVRKFSPDYTPYGLIRVLITLSLAINLSLMVILWEKRSQIHNLINSRFWSTSPQSTSSAYASTFTQFTPTPSVITTTSSPRVMRRSKKVAFEHANLLINRSMLSVLMSVVKRTKWVKSFIGLLLATVISSVVHPSCFGTVSLSFGGYLGSLLIFASRFGSETHLEFSKKPSKILSHTIFNEDEMIRSHNSIRHQNLPLVQSKTCLVMGAAGSTLWLEKAISLFVKYSEVVPDLSCLIMCDTEIFNVASGLKLPGKISLCEIDIDSPSEMRSARMLPMFIGDPSVYFLHRDADWDLTPLELQAIKLRTNLTCNPIGVSPSPVLMASVNYYGSAFKEQYSLWKDTKPYWKTYGHDERIARLFKVDYVYNRVTPLEEAIQYMSAVSTAVPDTRVIVPRVFLHNSANNIEVREWRACKISSYGDSSWKQALHKVSSSPKTFCGRKGVETIRTSFYWTAPVFLIASLVAAAIGEWIEPYFFSLGKTSHFLKTSHTRVSLPTGVFVNTSTSIFDNLSYTVGLFIGVYMTIPKATKAIERAKASLAEDSAFRDGFSGWNAARAVRGVQRVFRVDALKSSSAEMVSWFAFMVNPIGFVISKMALTLMPFLKPVDVFLANAFLFSGKSLSIYPAVLFLLSSLRFPGCFELGMLSGNVACIRTAHINYWSHYPMLGLKASVEVPHLGATDSEVSKSIVRREWIDPFVCAFRRKRELRVELPIGMLNSRTATAIYLQRRGFLRYKDYDKVCVYGSGIGGFAQGMLHEGLEGNLDLLTLPEVGFMTSESINSKMCSIQTILGDARGHSGSYGLVICDVSKSASDDIWWRNDFSEESAQALSEEMDLYKAVSLVRKGGDFVCSIGILNDRTLFTTLDFLALHFKEITVVDEPIKRDLGHHFIVAKRKLGRRHPDIVGLLPSTFSSMNESNCEVWHEFIRAVSQNSGNINPNGDWNSYFSRELSRIYRFGVRRVIDEPDFSFDLNETTLSPASKEFLLLPPVQYVDVFPELISSCTILEPNPLDSTEAYKVIGKVDPPPVQDRNFNPGIDFFTQIALSSAGLLPLKKTFDVPSQSNYAVRRGLEKRYNFKSQMLDYGRLDEVCDAFYHRYRPIFLSYDFTTPTQHEYLDELIKNSSNGFMYQGQAHTVKDLVQNHWHEIQDVMRIISVGGRLNLAFHASPKVEKKEVESLIEEAVPRLFMYQEGPVRTSKVIISYPLNQLIKERAYWHSSACGDVFSKAEIICSAYESYDDAAGCVFECVKWDGHVEAELFTKERMLLVRLLDGNPTATLLKVMLHSMAKTDIFGTVYMCSGDVIVFKRGNKKSGEADTSYGNKIKNDMIALDLVKTALGISYNDAFDRVTQVTEGDDKEIIGSLADIEKIAELRDQVYNLYGMPQKGEAAVIRRPENSSFCSHGSTRLSNGIAVPIRNLHEVLGRHIIPLSNGAFNIDFSMAARSLTSMMSMVATYWYLPHVRNLYKVIREVIPKDVIPAAVAREERWKFFRMIGIENPTKFDLDTYLVNRFGYTPYEGVPNHFGREILCLRDFEGLLNLRAPYVLDRVKTLIHESGNLYDATVWYEGLIPYDVISNDCVFWDNKSFKIQLLTEDSSQLRQSFLNGMKARTDVSFGTYSSVLGRAKSEVLHLVFHSGIGSQVEWCSSQLTSKRAKNRGFRGKKIVISKLSDSGEYEVLRTITTSSSTLMKTGIMVALAATYFVSPLLALSMLAIISLSEAGSIVKTNKFTIGGLTIRSDIAKVVSRTDPIVARVRSLKYEPSSQWTLGPAAVVAYANIGNSLQRYSLKPRVAIETIKKAAAEQRRFGVVIFDDVGDMNAYLFHNEKADSRVVKTPLSKRIQEMADLLGVDRSEIMPPNHWKFNGSMLTVTDWKGEYSYGQFERPLSKLQSLEGR